MSRIGKAKIKLEPGVSLNIEDTNKITVTGPKGLLSLDVDPSILVQVIDEEIHLYKKDEKNGSSALHGLYRALLANMVTGVSQGYRKSLELIGVGYKAEAKNSVLELALGYSHSIFLALPPEVNVKVEIGSDKIYVIHLDGIDKQLLGQIAAKLKSLRKVEPYKGKGVRLVGQFVRRKAGKSGKK